MVNSKRGAASKSAPKGLPVHKGGPTLADRMREIEEKFGKDNATQGLVARAGRKDVYDDNQDLSAVTVYVEMVPAPDQVERDYTHKGVSGKDIKQSHTIEVFDPAKLRAHEVGDRIAASGDTLEDAIEALATKIGVGGAK
jgi:hypothetical protein